MPVVEALEFFHSSENVPKSWADAIETDPGSVEDTDYYVNANKDEQRALAEIARRGF